MTQVDIKYLEDKDGNPIAPITHVNAVRDSNGDTLPEILDRDYPTTSKTPSEGSSEVSLVTRGEKYDYDKVNNATDVSGASGIGANLKYILLNGTTGEFEAALGSYVEEKVRSALGGLLHNLNKASVSSANLDVACIEHIPADANAGTPESYDFGSLSAAQLASVLGVPKYLGVISNNNNQALRSYYAYDVSGFPNDYMKVLNISDDNGCKLGIGNGNQLYVKFDKDSNWRTI